MTREKAIMVLRSSIAFRTLSSDELLAVEMGIKALEEQERQHRSYNYNSKSVFELMREVKQND